MVNTPTDTVMLEQIKTEMSQIKQEYSSMKLAYQFFYCQEEDISYSSKLIKVFDQSFDYFLEQHVISLINQEEIEDKESDSDGGLNKSFSVSNLMVNNYAKKILV